METLGSIQYLKVLFHNIYSLTNPIPRTDIYFLKIYFII